MKKNEVMLSSRGLRLFTNLLNATTYEGMTDIHPISYFAVGLLIYKGEVVAIRITSGDGSCIGGADFSLESLGLTNHTSPDDKHWKNIDFTSRVYASSDIMLITSEEINAGLSYYDWSTNNDMLLKAKIILKYRGML